MASRQTVAAVGLSLALHAGLVVLGLTMRQPEHGHSPVRVDCRVSEGPGLFLELSPGKRRKSMGRMGRDETDNTFDVTVAPSPVMPSISGREPGPVVVRPVARGGAGQSGGDGHQAGGGGVPAFYGVPVKGRRVVFVVDRSLSMGLGGAFRRARVELLACLRALPEGASFQVVLYNRGAEALQGERLIAVNETAITRVEQVLNETHPEGETDHAKALAVALGFEPEAIYLVTDADDLTAAQVHQITRINWSRVVLHTIDVSHRLRAAGMLEALARENGGHNIRLQ